MSFETCMKKYLNVSTTEDPYFYIRSTTNALNDYMQELEEHLCKPFFWMDGLITLPDGLTTLYNGKLGYYVPNHTRFDFEDVKKAMYCGDGSLTFLNLFRLFGEKFILNFNKIIALPYLGTVNIQSLPLTSFIQWGKNFMDTIYINSLAMTPELFLYYESTYLQNAIRSIIMPNIPATGTSYIIPGIWSGTITLYFGGLISV